ncbi:glycosyltransferase family 4 protein [Verrucomicrobiota bacterium]
MKRTRIAFLYHYFHPDSVISARLFSDLAQWVCSFGWDVEALPCNRSRRDETCTYSSRENWGGVRIRRIWRPSFLQESFFGRICNSIWMIAVWSGMVLRRSDRLPDIVVMGTDPILGQMAAWIIRMFRPSVRMVIWAHDLYPEAAVADGIVKEGSLLTRCLRQLVRKAYASSDLIVDMGECMQKRLKDYEFSTRCVTLTPWALLEPEKPGMPNQAVRRELFGDVKLAILYSGNLGRAHSFDEFLELASLLKDDSVGFNFSIFGNRSQELNEEARKGLGNIRINTDVAESNLGARLDASDIHMVSLRPEWSGTVVPSKFFASLAVGRPVLFAGPLTSSIAAWIAKYDLGWVLSDKTASFIADDLRSLASDRIRMSRMQLHCIEIYRKHFSREIIVNKWHEELKGIVSGHEDEESDKYL